MSLTGIIEDLMAAVNAVRMTPYAIVPGDGPELPACYVGLPSQLTDFASTGSCSLSLSVVVVVSRATDDWTAQGELFDLLDIDTISRFLTKRSDHWSDMAFVSITNFRHTTFGNASCLAADLNLQLRTT